MKKRVSYAALGVLGSVTLLLCGCGGFESQASTPDTTSRPAYQSSSSHVADAATIRRGNRGFAAPGSSTGRERVQYALLEPREGSAADSVSSAPVTRQVNDAFQSVTSATATRPLSLTVTKPTPVRSLLEMRHHDVIIQSWDLSCGAAALATILRYEWGVPVTEKQVAQGLMGRREYVEHPNLVQIREGFSLLDLKRYVQAHGFKGEGYGQLDFDDLVEKAPIMVPVDALGYNHFVIFRGVMGDRVLLADPAWGNRTMKVDKFKRMWLDYGKSMGHVGFVVDQPGVTPVGKLHPELTDFVTFD
jgi:hypothetical protein